MKAGRRQPIVAGIGALAVLSLAMAVLVLWPGLERRWRLEQIRKDPARLEEMLLSQRPAPLAAARDFVREPAGAEALFRLYLAELDRNEQGLGSRDYILRQTRRNAASRGLLALWQDGLCSQSWTVRDRGHASYSLANVPESALRRQRVLELLDAVVGRTFTAPGFEGLEFQVQRAHGGTADLPRWPGALRADEWYPWTKPTVPPMARHACYYRVPP